MRRSIRLLLTLLLAAAALCGCSTKEPESQYTAQNEIYTYQKVDSAKTQLVISRTGNIDVESLCKEFDALNPDVQVIYVDITGGNNSCKPLIDWVTHGYTPDIVISAAGFFSSELTAEYFENLSTNPLLDSYEAAALKRTATNDDIYWLPGPSDITAMMYNKTLFEQYGWEVPATFDEFVSLCLQIREDTNGEVEPWNPNAKYSNELLTAMEAFVYEEVFGGVENRSWYNDFTRGEASLIGHMEPYYDALQTLVDNGLLREEHFSYSATTRGKEFAAGKIAMINMSIYDADTDEFDFGYMPFPTTKGELGYLSDSYSCFVGVPKKERTEKEKDAVERFLAYFSSEQGQRTYIGKALKVSNVKGVQLNPSDDLAALQPAISEGHMFARLDFESSVGAQCNLSLHKVAQDVATKAKTAAECLIDNDREAYSPRVSETAPEVVATAKQDMTVLETSFYIADAYRAAADADIGLIVHGEAYRGNLMRVFKGALTPAFVSVLKPRSFANDSTLVKLSMTGRQLLDALNAPKRDDGIADAVYAYSGLRCEIAPWNELGRKYLSVKLADGGAIDPDRLYTVAAWDGTVADAYVTEVLERYEGTWEEMMTAQLKTDGEIAPASDGRVKLVWR